MQEPTTRSSTRPRTTRLALVSVLLLLAPTLALAAEPAPATGASGAPARDAAPDAPDGLHYSGHIATMILGGERPQFVGYSLSEAQSFAVYGAPARQSLQLVNPLGQIVGRTGVEFTDTRASNAPDHYYLFWHVIPDQAGLWQLVDPLSGATVAEFPITPLDLAPPAALAPSAAGTGLGAAVLSSVAATSRAPQNDTIVVNDAAGNGTNRTTASPMTPTGPSGYTYCADQGADCTFTGLKDVAYGAGSSFLYKHSVDHFVSCRNDVFGDPNSGTTNACYTKATDGSGEPAGFTYCVPEPQHCTFTGPADVKYGADGTFNSLTLSGGTDCTNTVFGDPLYGVGKACYTRIAGPPGYSYCASENNRCSYSGKSDVAYGAQGTFTYLNGVNLGIDCNNDLFGDPLYGIVKACFTKTSALPTGPMGYAFCANESGTCSFSGTRDVAFGANGRFYWRDGVSGSISCTTSAFGDPLPGTVKACFTRNWIPCGSNSPSPVSYTDGGDNNTRTVSDFQAYDRGLFKFSRVDRGVVDCAGHRSIDQPAAWSFDYEFYGKNALTGNQQTYTMTTGHGVSSNNAWSSGVSMCHPLDSSWVQVMCYRTQNPEIGIIRGDITQSSQFWKTTPNGIADFSRDGASASQAPAIGPSIQDLINFLALVPDGQWLPAVAQLFSCQGTACSDYVVQNDVSTSPQAQDYVYFQKTDIYGHDEGMDLNVQWGCAAIPGTGGSCTSQSTFHGGVKALHSIEQNFNGLYAVTDEWWNWIDLAKTLEIRHG